MPSRPIVIPRQTILRHSGSAFFSDGGAPVPKSIEGTKPSAYGDPPSNNPMKSHKCERYKTHIAPCTIMLRSIKYCGYDFYNT